jgi:hypothetical protein
MTFSKTILSAAAAIALSTSAAFATDLNTESDSRDTGINAQEAGEDVDLSSTATTSAIEEDGRIDAKEAGQEAN